MKYKFLDLNKQNNEIKGQIYSSIKQNIKNSSFIGGNDLNKFESEFSNYLNVKFC